MTLTSDGSYCLCVDEQAYNRRRGEELAGKHAQKDQSKEQMHAQIAAVNAFIVAVTTSSVLQSQLLHIISQHIHRCTISWNSSVNLASTAWFV